MRARHLFAAAALMVGTLALVGFHSFNAHASPCAPIGATVTPEHIGPDGAIVDVCTAAGLGESHHRLGVFSGVSPGSAMIHVVECAPGCGDVLRPPRPNERIHPPPPHA